MFVLVDFSTDEIDPIIPINYRKQIFLYEKSFIFTENKGTPLYKKNQDSKIWKNIVRREVYCKTRPMNIP